MYSKFLLILIFWTLFYLKINLFDNFYKNDAILLPVCLLSQPNLVVSACNISTLKSETGGLQVVDQDLS